jgi:hypothetical protein
MSRAALLPELPRDESTPPTKAEILTASSWQNAELIQRAKNLDMGDGKMTVDFTTHLESRARLVAKSDLCHVEMALISQAASLESLYANLIDRALRSQNMAHIEAFFRLGLRAQSQCRQTLETLAAVKNPPVIFAKQANISAGHQQVNNGNAPAHGKSETVPNELLTENQPTKAIGEVKHERLDTGAPGTASGIDSSMATVGEIDRGTLPRGQGKGINPNKLLKLARKDLKAADEALRGYMDTLKTKETTQ